MFTNLLFSMLCGEIYVKFSMKSALGEMPPHWLLLSNEVAGVGCVCIARQPFQMAHSYISGLPTSNWNPKRICSGCKCCACITSCRAILVFSLRSHPGCFDKPRGAMCGLC